MNDYNDLRNAITYLSGAKFANYSGQIVEEGNGLIVCEIGCACSEIESKRSDEYAAALVALLNGAIDLVALLRSIRDGITAATAYPETVAWVQATVDGVVKE